MYTDPLIVTSEDLNKRSYITFYFNNIRQRVFTGRAIGVSIYPNFAKSTRDRTQRLHALRQELLKLLIAGKYPYVPEQPKEVQLIELSVQELLKLALENKLRMRLSKRYKDDLTLIHDQFTAFLNPKELQAPITELKVPRMEAFLQRFSSSGTYYMRRRSDLSILVNAACKLAGHSPIATGLHIQKSKATLHEIYELDKMRELLNYLREHQPKLHLCCLMTYACWLRPHVEIRNLKKSHFRNQNKEIYLDGSENKGGKIRVVYVPDFVREVLTKFLEGLEAEDNLFSGSKLVYNKDYFSTQWDRIRDELLEKRLIRKNQTIYSFRHTAAVLLYRSKKNIYLIQKMLGHSSIGVTQKYLRGLGEVDMEELIDSAPEL